MSEAQPETEPAEPVQPETASAELAEPESEPAPVRPRRDLRFFLRRFAPAVVAIGIAIFATPLADRWPSKQTLEIALDAPAEVTRVSLAVIARGETDPVFMTTWNFAAGAAPARVQAEMATPDGPYEATIGILRVGAPPHEELKRVDLDGNRITLFAR